MIHAAICAFLRAKPSDPTVKTCFAAGLYLSTTHTLLTMVHMLKYVTVAMCIGIVGSAPKPKKSAPKLPADANLPADEPLEWDGSGWISNVLNIILFVLCVLIEMHHHFQNHREMVSVVLMMIHRVETPGIILVVHLVQPMIHLVVKPSRLYLFSNDQR